MAVATISPTQGIATPAGVGTTTITATVGSISGRTSLIVNQVSLMSIVVTLADPVSNDTTHTVTQQATAVGFNNDGHPSPLTGFTWSSSNPSVATIDPSSGVATWVGQGSTTITASISPVSGSATLTVAVPSSLAVTAAATTANPVVITGTGFTQQFVAIGSYASGLLDLTKVVNWSLSNSGVATIDATGVATSAGNVTTTSGGVTTVTNTTMIEATIGSLTVTSGQTLKVLQSFANGNQAIYDLMATVQQSGLTCSSCHVSTAVRAGNIYPGPAFYKTGDGGNLATYNAMDSAGYFTGGTGGTVYSAACVAPR